MRLGLALGYWGRGPDPRHLELAQEAERLGYDSVWTSEAWGSDAFTTLTWIAAHTSRIGLGTAVAQMAARTPTATAMQALTLDHLSGGRMLLGLGLSGPQVVEGWYGRPFPASPLTATREYVDIVRQVLRREAPVTLDGRFYPLPYRGPDGFRIAPMARAQVCDDVAEGLLPVKAMLAFYIGGMGHATRNFHAALMSRLGHPEAAHRIQALFLQGHRDQAVQAVPDTFADEISLIGPRTRIADRLAAWRAGPVTDLLVTAPDVETLRVVAEVNG
ncbi:LLM class F420-dependent oxidoreductase [Streptomyces sp. WAC 06725]|uniref:LLM class flavin-dependent oxidoreductase n=1 Tax=Streptomyces sp. WAC 06725 TaxID=2203209 RepID=UPI000F741987|nr:LLM class flavin-dependent oxidoreductase [Streptomyces sp. WAC 06725]RSO44187.1 LLM class F420-dependent oxidoreductase [Streptomyces sp. WAC 06725]